MFLIIYFLAMAAVGVMLRGWVKDKDRQYQSLPADKRCLLQSINSMIMIGVNTSIVTSLFIAVIEAYRFH